MTEQVPGSIDVPDGANKVAIHLNAGDSEALAQVGNILRIDGGGAKTSPVKGRRTGRAV